VRAGGLASKGKSIVTTLTEEPTLQAVADSGTAASDRVVGRYDVGRPGPLVVITAAIHGNEPAGVRALERVLTRLEADRLPLAGKLLGVKGNTRALRRGQRFTQRDLNRKWTPVDLARLLGKDAAQIADEDLEQRELLELLTPDLTSAILPIVFLDLHSTSASGPPFAAMADVLRNRRIAFALPIPLVLGLEEFVDGAMLGYVCDQGHVGVAVEGGRHGAPETIDNHEAAIWLALGAAGALPGNSLPERARWESCLERASRGVPRVLEIRHCHRVNPDDAYVTRPGFESFQPIRAGEIVAHDRRGEIRAPLTGVILLPLYQSQGEDGYFLARRLSGFWLSLSRVLRSLRLDRIVPWLPGVHRHPEDRDRFTVNPRVARIFASEIFHLFGYRRIRSAGQRLEFSRRRPDHRGLTAVPSELTPLI
jgi:succinylglutamate desuccinylase